MDEQNIVMEMQKLVSVCVDRILKLENENNALRNEIKAVAKVVLEITDDYKNHKVGTDQQITNMLILLQNERIAMDNLVYEANDPNIAESSLFYPKIHPIDYTIDKIVKDHASMARFGDGEFSVMTNRVRQKFQEPNELLATKLKTVIGIKDDRFIVGIADNYGELSKYNYDGKAGIRQYMTEEIRKEHQQFLSKDTTYHNAYISRPYALFSDNMTDAPKKRFERLKEIWNNRDIIFVEGAQTRLGVGNDLFDNAKSIKRIIAPPTNSFSKYDEIYDAAIKNGTDDTLFIIALGPTAGALAYDLYKEGYQALDMGHVDLEYEYFLNGSGHRCEVRNKYNNEFYGGDEVDDICDDAYENQIIAKCL